jgi:hypothetical protein
MAARRQWSDLSGRTRRLLAITAVAEGILKLAAHRFEWRCRRPSSSPRAATGQIIRRVQPRLARACPADL